MKKRICSLLLICSMLAGLLPQIVLPQAAAADTAAARDGFGLPRKKNGITDTATLRITHTARWMGSAVPEPRAGCSRCGLG